MLASLNLCRKVLSIIPSAFHGFEARMPSCIQQAILVTLQARSVLMRSVFSKISRNLPHKSVCSSVCIVVLSSFWVRACLGDQVMDFDSLGLILFIGFVLLYSSLVLS
ncbi:hypothetical protein Drorol1_Dr00018416 [Drosera rotundifolia]